VVAGAGGAREGTLARVVALRCAQQASAALAITSISDSLARQCRENSKHGVSQESLHKLAISFVLLARCFLPESFGRFLHFHRLSSNKHMSICAFVRQSNDLRADLRNSTRIG